MENILGNAVTVLLVAIVGFLFKRWMESIDKKIDKIETKFDNNFANTTTYREQLSNDIKSIGLEMKVANGRTGKLEGKIDLEIGKLKGKLDTQIALCTERNGIHGAHQPFGYP